MPLDHVSQKMNQNVLPLPSPHLAPIPSILPFPTISPPYPLPSTLWEFTTVCTWNFGVESLWAYHHILCLIQRKTVTGRAQGYTLQDASFIMRQSWCSFLNAWDNTQVVRARNDKHLFVWNTRWRHGRFRGETKYSLKHILFIAMFYLTSLW